MALFLVIFEFDCPWYHYAHSTLSAHLLGKWDADVAAKYLYNPCETREKTTLITLQLNSMCILSMCLKRNHS